MGNDLSRGGLPHVRDHSYSHLQYFCPRLHPTLQALARADISEPHSRAAETTELCLELPGQDAGLSACLVHPRLPSPSGAILSTSHVSRNACAENCVALPSKRFYRCSPSSPSILFQCPRFLHSHRLRNLPPLPQPRLLIQKLLPANRHHQIPRFAPRHYHAQLVPRRA